MKRLSPVQFFGRQDSDNPPPDLDFGMNEQPGLEDEEPDAGPKLEAVPNPDNAEPQAEGTAEPVADEPAPRRAKN